ncbi:hypothetical protein Y1Q_0001051 [Alligator mississippiensis]|uniref:Uncharacterized protein n=1 Tax=Alligator mississippiensis TaxID=8496 RepID=A0A151NEC9_ALLMI|nr:hypothetical protein Y1Q_0001051 [Alligator mississippiensis]
MFAGSGYNTEGNWTLSIFKFVEQSSIMLQGPDHQKNKTQEMTDEITNTVMGHKGNGQQITRMCAGREKRRTSPTVSPTVTWPVSTKNKNVEEPALALEAQTAGIYTDTVQAWDTEDSLYTCELETMSEDTGKKDPPIPEEMGVHTAGISKKTVLLF